ncbi:MAG: prepilin-type N-terminal cleavage/methylation domain-containing protein [Candidatus Harrisonbacteria bacterium]|nr:prepilin-type N-terminal cleavage/methylation domain-containing protein [Candidatus Harrisonbacteria bacterium]
MKNSGFTIVELLVAITLFSVIVAIATGTFIQALRTQRGAAGLIAANSNASLAIEQISREIRTGRAFSLSGGVLNFTNAKEQAVSYRLNNESIERIVGGEAGIITAANAKVAKLNFILAGESSTDGLPTKITVILEIGAPEAAGAKINLQTTVSSRILEG